MPIRQAHHCFNKVTVIKRSPKLALELDLVPFTGRRPPGNPLRQIPSRVGLNRHLGSSCALI